MNHGRLYFDRALFALLPAWSRLYFGLAPAEHTRAAALGLHNRLERCPAELVAAAAARLVLPDTFTCWPCVSC